MKATLAEHVPPGMDLAHARRFMEKEGFACRSEHGVFIEKTWFADVQPLHDGIDFVHCSRADSAGFLMGRVWDIALVHKGNVVTKVLVSHYLDGP